jgi:hypothetical protein
MSKITENDLLKNYSGIFGNQVLLKNRRGKSVMTIPPVKVKGEPTEKQSSWRQRFRLGSRFAKLAMQDPELRALYEARSRNGLSPYVLAMTDYLCSPEVNQIDRAGYRGNPGDMIVVTADDNFGVTKVTVTITDPSGAPIEEGECTENLLTGRYEYTATVAVPERAGVTILARAFDRPGNCGELSLTL